jgi:hypothetical protein
VAQSIAPEFRPQYRKKEARNVSSVVEHLLKVCKVMGLTYSTTKKVLWKNKYVMEEGKYYFRQCG